MTDIGRRSRRSIIQGLGAGVLLTAIGCAPTTSIDHMTLGGGSSSEHGFLHMFPRGDVVVLGGIFRLGDSSRNVEVDETERIVGQHNKLFDTFG